MDVRVNKRMAVRIIQIDGVFSTDRHWGYGRALFGAAFNLGK